MDRPQIEIDTDDGAAQYLAPPSGGHRFEGLAFSNAGDKLAVAAIGTNRAFIFRRRPTGDFEGEPFQTFGGSGAEMHVPHDVSCATCGRIELLAVVQRVGVISIFAKPLAAERFPDKPEFEIRGPQTRLLYSDGVAFVPPHFRFLAVNNLTNCSLTFYRRTSLTPPRFDLEPALELTHPCLVNPDGLGFSPCGRWLAVANHANHSVSVFKRRSRWFNRGRLLFDPEPVQVIRDPALVHPHSVAFTPGTNHLAVTNSGANWFCVFAPRRRDCATGWYETPIVSPRFAPADVFAAVNSQNKMKGGPKGIAIHEGVIAASSPEIGIRLYPYRER